MAKQVIGLGAAPNDESGDDLRAGGQKINDNFTELYDRLDTDGTMAANSASKTPSQSAVVTYIAARIAALVASSPAALDTLNELAAALGNDANYAATITAALAAKAPKSPVVTTVASSATVTPAFGDDMTKITAQAVGLTLANWSGTAIPAWGMVVRVKDNGTARAIGYGNKYRAIGVTLPTTTVIGKTTYLGIIYNSDDDKFDVLSVGQEA